MNLTKKMIATGLSAVMAANLLSIVGLNDAYADNTRYEFEDATYTASKATDMEIASDDAASGGEVLYMKDSGEITLTFSVPSDDNYEIVMAAEGVGSNKQQNIYIDGVSSGSISIAEGDGTYTPFTATSQYLTAGEHTLKITKNWGWTKFDYMEVQSKVYDTVSASSDLSDPNATDEAQSLMNYLASVYGEHTISGQQEIYMYGHDFEQEFQYIENLTGEQAAIRGFDYLNEANILGYGTEDGTTDRIIQWCTSDNLYGNAGIATASWHLTVPVNFSSYTLGDSVDYNSATYSCSIVDGVNTKTDFDTANVIVEGTKENQYYMACLEEISTYLLKLQDAGVPLIFRPLHEAEGGGDETGSWFWWGAAGSSVYKQIWQLTYKTLTETYGIHNLIWEWNGYNFATSGNWYPGDEYVDLVGYDKYSCTKYLAENNWQASREHDATAAGDAYWSLVNLTDQKKMVSMAENDCFSTLENLETAHATWLYFCTWYDGGGDTNFLSDPIYNTEEDTIAMYQSDYCITLDELPSDLYGNADAKITTESKATTEATTTTTIPNVVVDGADNATISRTSSATTLTFDKAMGESVTLIQNVDDDVTYFNGCLGVSVEVDGEYYWVSFQYENTKSGEQILTNVDLTSPYNITYNNGADEVDLSSDLAAQCIAKAQEQKTAQYQVWYVGVGEDSGKTSKVTLVGAYLNDATVETTTTEATTTTEEETTTTTVAEETTTAAETTTASEAETTTVAETTTTTVATTSASSTDETPITVMYGDINLDNEVNMADLIMLNKLVAGIITPTTQQSANADLDLSGSVDGTDAKYLLQFNVHVLSALPYVAE